MPLVLVSHRFHFIIFRVLHFRLLLAADLAEYTLILEAYRPWRKNTEPYLFCTSLGTDGRSSKHEGEGRLYGDCPGVQGKLAKLGALYSRFRPERPGVEKPMPRRAFTSAGTPSQVTAGGPAQPIYANTGDGGDQKVVYNVHLDRDELFCQFCAYPSLVKIGPRRGVFLNLVPIMKGGEGVMRIWRDWLQTRAEAARLEAVADLDRNDPSKREATIGTDSTILWQDDKRTLGLRLFVRDITRRSVSQDANEDEIPLDFAVEIRGEWFPSALTSGILN